MPKNFTECVAAGGKIVTKQLSGGRYMHLCKDKNNRWHTGEVKKKKMTLREARKHGNMEREGGKSW